MSRFVDALDGKDTTEENANGRNTDRSSTSGLSISSLPTSQVGVLTIHDTLSQGSSLHMGLKQQIPDIDAFDRCLLCHLMLQSMQYNCFQSHSGTSCLTPHSSDSVHACKLAHLCSHVFSDLLHASTCARCDEDLVSRPEYTTRSRVILVFCF